MAAKKKKVESTALAVIPSARPSEDVDFLDSEYDEPPVIDVEPEGGLGLKEIGGFSVDDATHAKLREKLVHLISNINEAKEKRREVAAGYNDLIKGYEVQARAIAQAVRYKNDHALIKELGDDWAMQLGVDK